MAVSTLNVQKCHGKNIEGWSMSITNLQAWLQEEGTVVLGISGTRKYVDSVTMKWLIAVLYFQAENPNAALSFYWEPLKKAVRVEGHVEKLSASESDEYFHSRPILSQIGAVVSEQSKPIVSRDVFIERRAMLLEQYGDGSEQLPRPKHWGGYLVVPEVIEFWQGQTDRLHDRIRFRRPKSGDEPDGVLLHQGDNGWVYERLSP
ncbi:pyridoxine-5'-phosphate oxidase isoform X3 [Cryptotermes secundus]|uniref:pyridoxine-5'-phosphate oxidase isoform X3 n=1 Tax=Cryptotermes secundus TaxID=105785 RepID=UPI000CD7DC28|nr:pyridoxine-5'-phosphate oxidase isoform X3 [Cryptotermes secundus]